MFKNKLFGMMLLIVGIMLAFSFTACDNGGKQEISPRDISSFADITWRSDTLLETVTHPITGEEESIPSTFSIWINDDGEAAVQTDFIHWQYEPRAEVRGDTLVITIGEGEEYATFKIEGNTLVRTIAENGRENRHIYTKRDE